MFRIIFLSYDFYSNEIGRYYKPFICVKPCYLIFSPMNRLVIFCFCFFLSVQNLFAQQIPIGTWKDELPYLHAKAVVQSANKIYCATDVSLYSVDKSDFSFEKLSKVNGLSDIGFSTLYFDGDRNQLLIAYSNSNIDILDSAGTYNISDIKRKNIVGDKNIYKIFQRGSMAYLCCGFGIAVLNLAKREISDTYYPGQTVSYNKVNSMTADDTFFYAATASGLYRAAINSSNLSDFSQWTKINSTTALPDAAVSDLLNINQSLYCSVKDSLYKFDGTQWTKIFWRDTMHIRSLHNGNGELLICMNSDSSGITPRVIKISATNSVDSIPTNFNSPWQSLKDENGNYWTADDQLGLKYFSATEVKTIYPLGPLSQKAADIAVRNGIAY
ncbi:MAG: hypothetical protein WCI97_05470, partial [Bacteroidota bacterium]